MKGLKLRLGKRQLSIGSWITLSDLSTAEIMAKSGFDWLVVDMEHSAITLHQAQQLIQIIELCDVVPLVRVSENNPTIIKRVMDAGAHGVVVPMVNSRIDAERAVQAVRYPPKGIRGVGLARAQGYGLEFERYKNWVNSRSIVIVQVEHITAVENLSEILEVEGVDGFIVGPYDLSASLGKPGEFDHPKVKNALAKIKDIAKKKNALMGFHVIPPEAEELAKRMKEGYRFLGFSLDTLFLGVKCRNELAKIRR